MNGNLTEIVFILDRSGSMAGLEDDTIGGFNAMVEKQKKEPGEAVLSAVLFSNDNTVIYDRTDIRKVEPLTDRQYFVGGSTALLDAIGGAIHHIVGIHRYARKEDIPDHTIFVITTDGMENASHRYGSDQVKKMIQHEKEKYGWEFIFLASNIDAVETARGIGIDADHAVDCLPDMEGSAMTFDAINKAVHNVRCGACLSADLSWRKDADDDFKKRRR